MIALPGLLEGRAALVVGAGRGIGGAVARLFAAAGASVAAMDVEARRAEETAEEVRGLGAGAMALAGDARDGEAVDAAVAAVTGTWGRLDVLVNVAGGMHGHAPWRRTARWTDEHWDDIVERNLRYVFLTCRAAVGAMLEAGHGGSIVNISSISGATSAPRHSAYGAAKAGLLNLTRTLAVEYGAEGIRVNAVAPGSVLTPATRDVHTPELARRSRETIPLGRPADPEEIAAAVLFLASPLAAYVTGQTLLVDGGASARFPLTGPQGDDEER